MSFETSDALTICDECGRYMTSDREIAPMPAGPLASNEGTPEDPLPSAYSAGNTLTCQPCAYRIKGERLIDLGVVVPVGECSTCDDHYWSSPTLDPGGPAGRHSNGSGHNPPRTHCTCGRPGCGTTD